MAYGRYLPGVRYSLQCLILALVFPVAAHADALPLPVSTALDCKSLDLDLRGGRVDVVIDPDAEEPSLEATDYVDSNAARGFVVLEPGANGTLHVGQAYGEDAVAPRVLIKLVLHPDQQLTIRGSDLAISIEDLRGLGRDDDASASKPITVASGSPDALTLSPNDSDVHLVGVGAVTLGGQRTRYRLERTHGQVRAQLKRGSIESAFHRGNIDLTASDTDLRVTSFSGLLATRQDGGAAVVQEGSGSLDIAIDAPNACEVSGFVGAISINVKHGAARIERSGSAESVINLIATQVDLEIEELTGRLNLQLADGSLKLRQAHGSVTVAAQGNATLELSELLDILELRTQDGVDSKVHGVQKRFTARIRDGKLKAETLADIDLVTNNAQVWVQEVSAASRIDLTDTESELDISSAQGFPTIKLLGGSRTRMVLRDPCMVRIDGDLDALRNQLQVDGCELIGDRDSSPLSFRRNPTQQPQIITVNLGSEAELTVRARP